MDTDVKLHTAYEILRRSGDRVLAMLVLFRDTTGKERRAFAFSQHRMTCDGLQLTHSAVRQGTTNLDTLPVTVRGPTRLLIFRR
jgi:hypothetical protein